MSASTDETIHEDEFRPPTRLWLSAIPLVVPSKKLVKAISKVAVSRGLSVRDQTVVVASVVKAAGRDVNDFTFLEMSLTLSTTSIWRKKMSSERRNILQLKLTGCSRNMLCSIGTRISPSMNISNK